MHRPKDVADNLGISAATLRLWSNNFAAVLSPAAQKSTTETGTAAQRRYSDSDISYFRRAKQLLAQGLTYEQTLDRLREQPPTETLPSSETPPVGEPQHGISLVTDRHPVIAAFEEALKAKDEALASQRETIDALKHQIALLESRPPAPAVLTSQARFKWGFLNRLLVEGSSLGD